MIPSSLTLEQFAGRYRPALDALGYSVYSKPLESIMFYREIRSPTQNGGPSLRFISFVKMGDGFSVRAYTIWSAHDSPKEAHGKRREIIEQHYNAYGEPELEKC